MAAKRKKYVGQWMVRCCCPGDNWFKSEFGKWPACPHGIREVFEKLDIPFDKVHKFRVVALPSANGPWEVRPDSDWTDEQVVVSLEGLLHFEDGELIVRVGFDDGELPNGRYDAWIEYEWIEYECM